MVADMVGLEKIFTVAANHADIFGIFLALSRWW